MEKKKPIKAVPMVRKIRNVHHEHLKDKPWEERVAFYRQRAQTLHRELKAEREAASNSEKG